MAFPQSVLPIKQEILIGGTWTDITSRTRNDASVDITRGNSSEQAALSPGSAGFTLNNRDFYFSGRSPSSANYGQLGRNTQYRASLTESTTWLRMADYSDSAGTYDGARAGTADKAVLDVTGDIDIRIDVRPDDWRGGHGMALASKYEPSGNSRSWLFWLDRMGYLRFRWTTDGTTATAHDVSSDAVVSALRRQALRVTLDVNNGSGGWTLTFYTADTIAGSWTQLGSQASSTPTTSIYSGGAALFAGAIQLATATSGTYGRGEFAIGSDVVQPFVGRIYRMQVYNGIGGTLVADMDATSQAAGTTSWSDGLATANTWILRGSAEITKQNFRFWGEIPDFPQEWDQSGNDIFARCNAYDLISRKQQGSKSLHSSIYRNLIRSSALDGYWPMENGSQATSPSPAAGTYGTMSNAIFSADEDFPGSEGVLSFSSDSGIATGGCVPISTVSSTGVVTLLVYFRAPSVPAATSAFINFYLAGGNTNQVTLRSSATAYDLVITTTTGTSLLSSSVAFGAGAEPNQPMAMRVMLTQNGGNVDYEWAWYPVGAPVVYGVSGSYAGTVGGYNVKWTSTGFTNKSGWWLAHIGMFREDIDFSAYAFTASTNAYVGEHCESRFTRLCIEERVPNWLIGHSYVGASNPDVGETMGPQTAQPFMTLIGECQALDRGMVYAPRDKFGLTFRLHASLINRDAVELDYSQNHLSVLKPRGDLFFVRNDVTVTNATGGSARAVRTSGTLNVNEPEDDANGVGTFDPGPVTRIAELDDRLPALAQEEVFYGTWDELRYPNVGIMRQRADFTASALLDADVLDADLGDVVRVANPPSQLPPDAVELLVLGYAESLQNRGHPITWNTAPYGPYRFLNDLSGSSLAKARLAATSSVLTSLISSSDNSFSVTTAAGLLWRTGSSSPTFPMEIVIGGEVMSVGSISGSSSPQTFSSVTRSVNGVVAGHDALSAVQVRDRFYIGRDSQ